MPTMNPPEPRVSGYAMLFRLLLVFVLAPIVLTELLVLVFG